VKKYGSDSQQSERDINLGSPRTRRRCYLSSIARLGEIGKPKKGESDREKSITDTPDDGSQKREVEGKSSECKAIRSAQDAII